MRIRCTSIVAQYMDAPHRRMFDLRACGLPEIPLLGWQSYAKARPDLPLHRHPGCLEIHLCERGTQVFQVGDRRYCLNGGDLFLTLPNELHSTGGYPCGPGNIYCLLVKVPKPGGRLLGLSVGDTRSLLHPFLTAPDRQFGAIRAVKNLFDELLKLRDEEGVLLRRPRIRATVLHLLLAILDSSARHTQKSQPSRRISQVVQTIRDCPEREYRLQSLAKQTHLSLSRFKGRFKSETGLSPRQFILQTKIEAAQTMLRTGDQSITQIAMDLGFVSSQYFATVFKRIAGETPRHYRQNSALRRPSVRVDDGQG